MSYPSNTKLTGSVLGLSLVAVGAGLYLSPVGTHLPKPKVVRAFSAAPTQTVTVARPASDPAAHPKITKTVVVGRKPAAAPTSTTRVIERHYGSPDGGYHGGYHAGSSRGPGSTVRYVGTHSPETHSPETHSPETHSSETHSPETHAPETHSSGTHSSGTHSSGTRSSGPAPTSAKPTGSPSPTGTSVGSGPKAKGCWDFKYQQDAQAEYVKNLSDPWGLDSAAGPHNGDGKACMNLPQDPSRAPSIPVDPFVPPAPTAASKQSLVHPAKKYYGISQDELPGNVRMYDDITAQAGKAPSLVEWFDTWDNGYDRDGAKVKQSWARGALPVLTWMPEAKGGSTKDQSVYSLDKIANGAWDDYLYRWAAQVVQTKLPMGIRFAHEMNGNWYPWSGGVNKATGQATTPAIYRAAWQHVWNVFQRVGANDYVIWIWTPIRVNGVDPGHHGYTTLKEDYPGDRYVDWVGMSGYEYKFGYRYGFDTTFGATFTQLKDLTTKPIFIAETGATAAINTRDTGPLKARWISDALAGFMKDPQVVGFAYFDNRVDGVHKVDNRTITTDWRINTSPEVQAAFRRAVSDPGWATGIAANSE